MARSRPWTRHDRTYDLGVAVSLAVQRVPSPVSSKYARAFAVTEIDREQALGDGSWVAALHTRLRRWARRTETVPVALGVIGSLLIASGCGGSATNRDFAPDTSRGSCSAPATLRARSSPSLRAAVKYCRGFNEIQLRGRVVGLGYGGLAARLRDEPRLCREKVLGEVVNDKSTYRERGYVRVLIFASHAAWERCSTEMDSAINSSTPRLWVNPYRGWSAASGDDGHTSPATAF